MTRNSQPPLANKKQPVTKIGMKELFPTILEICPFYKHRWDAHLKYYEEELPFVAIPDFVYSSIERLEIGSEKQVVKIFEAIEHLYDRGDNEVRELLKVAVFEEFEHIFGKEAYKFEKYLRPISSILRRECKQRLREMPYHVDSSMQR